MPRDELLGSPMERLMGRKAQTLLPSVENLLMPVSRDPEVVHRNLSQYRQLQKKYHDRSARPLPKISASEDAVRIRTPRGWEPAEYVSSQHHNSHMVKAGDQARLYRRNRRDLIVTRETPHQVQPAAPATMLPPIPMSPMKATPGLPSTPISVNRRPLTGQNPNTPNSTNNASPSIASQSQSPITTTKSGRQVKLPPRFKDMVLTK
jgi:hypothetical protein